MVNKKEILEPGEEEMRWQQLHPVQEHGADGVGKAQGPIQMLCTINWTVQIKRDLKAHLYRDTTVRLKSGSRSSTQPSVKMQLSLA